MTKLQTQVKEFHQAFGIVISEKPAMQDEATIDLRIALIREEFDELQQAFEDGSIVDIADALGDLLYVIYGAGVSFGIDLEPVTDEIHRSNMTKVNGHRAENGKWIKPADYSPADLAAVIERQTGK